MMFFQKQNDCLFLFHLAHHQHTLGHILRTRFLNKDIISSWCTIVLFSYIVMDDVQCKKRLLEIKLLDRTQTTTQTLMKLCIDLLQDVNK